MATKVGIRTTRVNRRRVRITGTIWPQIPSGQVSLQRQARTGHWHTIAHFKPTNLSGGRSHYRFTVTRGKRALAYRALVLARDGGAHSPGASRVVRIAKRG